MKFNVFEIVVYDNRIMLHVGNLRPKNAPRRYKTQAEQNRRVAATKEDIRLLDEENFVKLDDVFEQIKKY